MFTITFIRHGESEDNLKNIWAGWKDAPLSDLGVKQAKALGESFSSTPVSIIYSSPLKRAYSTALAVQRHQPLPHPLLISNPDLREQHFGIAEGRKWTEDSPAIDAAAASPDPESAVEKVINELAAQSIFPVIPTTTNKFPDGESLNDLARRAERGLKECVLNHLSEYFQPSDGISSTDDYHVAVASHGLCISELVAALVKLDPLADQTKSYRGLLNTAWTRAVIGTRDGFTGTFSVSSPPPLEVKIIHFNDIEHLKGLDTTGPIQLEGARQYFAGNTSISN
ncbi:phosphoglycerate mutase [Amanita muscaria]